MVLKEEEEEEEEEEVVKEDGFGFGERTVVGEFDTEGLRIFPRKSSCEAAGSPFKAMFSFEASP